MTGGRCPHQTLGLQLSNALLGKANLAREFGPCQTNAPCTRAEIIRAKSSARHGGRLICTVLELLANDFERKVLISLHRQNASQLKDIALGEPAVAGGGSLRSNETLRFKESDLADGNLREFALEQTQHLTDAQGPDDPAACSLAHEPVSTPTRKTNLNFPIWISSPPLSR